MEEMTQETKATAAEKQEARTFSQEEVNAIVQKRVAEEKAKAQKQASPEVDEREKAFRERENKLAISERKFTAKQLLADEKMPAEFIDFLDYSTDESYKESITKLSDIFFKYGLKDTGARVTINTGLSHGTATKDSYDDFTRILKE